MAKDPSSPAPIDVEVKWYSTRLEAESRRPQASEMRTIFASMGLDDDFCDPGSDRFG